MDNKIKRKTKIIVAAICVLIIAVIVALAAYSSSLIEIDSREVVIELISSSEEKQSNNSLQKSIISNESSADGQIEYNTVKKDGYAAVYYQTGETNNIIILKESSLFKSKYKLFGSEKNTSSYCIYKYTETQGEETESVFAVSIRKLDDFAGASKLDISKIYDETDEDIEALENETVYSKNIADSPYFDLKVINCNEENEYSLTCEIYDNGNNAVYTK